MTCENGKCALERLKSFTPDLILLDLSMPDMDGPEFMKALHQVDGMADTPIIFVTQFDNVKMQGNYKMMNVIGILHKPIDAERILMNIRDLWVAR